MLFRLPVAVYVKLSGALLRVGSGVRATPIQRVIGVRGRFAVEIRQADQIARRVVSARLRRRACRQRLRVQLIQQIEPVCVACPFVSVNVVRLPLAS